MAAAPPVLPPPPGAPPPQAAAGSPSWFSVLVVVGASVTTLAGGLVVFVLHLRPVLKAAERAAAAAEVAARQMEVAALVRHGVGKRRVTLVQHAAVRQNGGRQHCTQPLSCHRAADLPCWRLSPLPHPVAPANPGPPSRNWSCFIQSLVRCFAAGDGEDGTGDAGGHAADVPGHAGAPPPPPSDRWHSWMSRGRGSPACTAPPLPQQQQQPTASETTSSAAAAATATAGVLSLAGPLMPPSLALHPCSAPARSLRSWASS